MSARTVVAVKNQTAQEKTTRQEISRWRMMLPLAKDWQKEN